MADKQHIHNMIDNLINKKGEEAQIDWHQYAKEKFKEILDTNNNESKKPTEKQ